METMTAVLDLIKEYGLALVGLVYFIYIYVKNNKDTLNLIIAIKDEDNNIHNAHVEAIYVLKDELKNEISLNTEKILKVIDKDFSTLSNEISQVDQKTSRVEMYLLIKRGDDK